MRFPGILLAATALVPAMAATLSAQQSTGEAPADTAAAPATAPATPIPLPHSYAVSNGALVVAPGLVLPNGNLPWVLDELNGRPVLVPLHHATLNSESGSPGTATLPGPHSSNILHRTTPVIFIHTSDRTENARDLGRLPARPLWLLIPAIATGTSRSVTRPAPDDPGKPSGCPPSTICLVAEVFPDGWLRVVPTTALEPGDYVLMPAIRPVKAPAEVVYDLTVNPAAPADRDTVYAGSELPARKKRR